MVFSSLWNMSFFLQKCIWGEFADWWYTTCIGEQSLMYGGTLGACSSGQRRIVLWCRVVIHGGHTLAGWCLCVCVCVTVHSSLYNRNTFFWPSRGFPNETLFMQTMTSKLYSSEDEWLLCWPLLSPDNILPQHRITTFSWSTEASGDKRTIQNGNKSIAFA